MERDDLSVEVPKQVRHTVYNSSGFIDFIKDSTGSSDVLSMS
jgi:hypothetical protein